VLLAGLMRWLFGNSGVALRIWWCPSDMVLPFGYGVAPRIWCCPSDMVLPLGYGVALRVSIYKKGAAKKVERQNRYV